MYVFAFIQSYICSDRVLQLKIWNEKSYYSYVNGCMWDMYTSTYESAIQLWNTRWCLRKFVCFFSCHLCVWLFCPFCIFPLQFKTKVTKIFFIIDPSPILTSAIWHFGCLSCSAKRIDRLLWDFFILGFVMKNCLRIVFHFHSMMKVVST